MSGYYQQGNNTVTPIDMLPELEDVTTPQPYERAVKGQQIKGSRYPGEGILAQQDAQRVQKFIRENHVSPGESGMNYKQVQDTYMLEPPSQTSGDVQQQYPMLTTNPEPNCIDCARHASGCPVCKSYFNNDKTILYIAIIVLIVICLLLLKKVLDM